MRTALAIRIAICTLIAALTIEVCVRVDDRITHGAPLLRPYTIARIYSHDELGVRGKPNATYLKWKLNGAGFRGPELRSGLARIVCIGSSETFGLYEAEDGEYPRRLEKELNKRLGRELVEVVNVAYPGMSLAASVRRIPEILKVVRPQMATIYPSLAAYVDLKSLAPPSNPRNRPGPFFELRIQSRIETIVKRIAPQWMQTRVREWQINRVTRNGKLLERIPEENVARFRDDLEALVVRLQAGGVTPVLVTHATRFGRSVSAEERPMLVAWRKFYPMLQEEGFLDMERRMNDVIRQVARERHLPLIDIAERMPPGPEHFAEFVHFTDRGAEVMAGLLADELLPLMSPALQASR